MKRKLITAAMLALVHCAALAAAPNYKIVDTIAIGGAAHWDYLYLDGAAHRLYVSHEKQVEVIDTTSDKLVGSITGVNGAHGIAVATELGLGYITSGDDNAVLVFNLTTLKVQARIKAGTKPDAIVYDAADQLVVALNGHSNNATIIDAKKGLAVATVAFPSNPEFAQADSKGRVYVNLEGSADVAVLDVKAHKVTRVGSIKPCEEPTGLAMDDKQHLYSACKNKLMMVTGTDGHAYGSLPIGAGPDGAAWLDGYAFSANGKDGTLSIVGETGPGKFETVATVTTQYGARTIAADPATHRLYLPTADFDPAVGEEKRQAKPDTFRVLVLERQ